MSEMRIVAREKKSKMWTVYRQTDGPRTTVWQVTWAFKFKSLNSQLSRNTKYFGVMYNKKSYLIIIHLYFPFLYQYKQTL